MCTFLGAPVSSAFAISACAGWASLGHVCRLLMLLRSLRCQRIPSLLPPSSTFFFTSGRFLSHSLLAQWSHSSSTFLAFSSRSSLRLRKVCPSGPGPVDAHNGCLEAFAYHYTARLSARLNQPVKRDLAFNTASSRHLTSNLTSADIPAACSDSCTTNAVNAISVRNSPAANKDLC